MKSYYKYIITIAVFLFFYLFIGDKSVVHRIRLHRDAAELREERDQYRAEVEKASRQLQSLQSLDSLERYAREQYFMHAPGETIYVVE